MRDGKISGWRSDFARARVQLDRQRERLLGLVGRRVTAGWTGWDPERDRWFEDIPLVLVIDDGTQLELAWQAWDGLSVTWDTIDLAVGPEVVGRPHEWRPSAPEPLAAVVGRVVTEIAVTESPCFRGGDDVDFNVDPLPWHAFAGWVTSGLWIVTGGVGLHVYNGPDANGLETVPFKPGYESATRVSPLATFVGEG
ncbi:hypothetical protein [Dactylosporangium sp. NPDC050588]|uniref:hypothetical protein n=1 Tax=Dactylosporangium sp. NPDC050588 TaxID=3157211 RepID=UPI0033FB9435